MRGRTVRDDWFAWLPEEMGQLFGATRNELEFSNEILSVTLDEVLALSEQEEFTIAKERVVAFGELFDRLAIRLRLVIRTIEEHGSHFGTLPNVTPLAAENFRGTTAQRISFVDSLLSKVVFRGRTPFFHKLYALKEIIEELQNETRIIVEDVIDGAPVFPVRAWRELEVLGYDLNTCMGETTIMLKSFFCALPDDEVEVFRRELVAHSAIESPNGLVSVPVFPGRAFDGPARDVSDSHRDPTYSRPTREVSGSTSGASVSGFFREISESPRMKFRIAWVSFGMLVVPLAALVAGGMSERAALLTMLAAILPVQYLIFVANNKIGAAAHHTAAPDEEEPHKESFGEERLESDSAERRGPFSKRVRRIRYLTPEEIAAIK
jgi:hypothetical protein